MTPEKLSEALRHEKTPFLQRRRWIAALSLFDSAAMGLITLYQLGILKSVPEPPLPGANADRINGSHQAYKLLETPDAVLAVGSYAATLTLAAMGEPDRSRAKPWLPIALAGKTAIDAAVALKLFRDQIVKYRGFSFWSVLTIAATIATVPLALPEAREAYRQIASPSGKEETS